MYLYPEPYDELIETMTSELEECPAMQNHFAGDYSDVADVVVKRKCEECDTENKKDATECDECEVKL